MKQTYDEWTAIIRAGWERDNQRNRRFAKKMKHAIQNGEFRVDGSYIANGRTYHIVTKV